VLGVPKIGKSSWAAGAPRAIVLPIKGEEGVDDLAVSKTPVCNNIADVFGWLSTLRSDKHDYGTAVIDSTSTLETLVWDEVCMRHNVDNLEKVLKGYGKGYIEAVKVWRELTEWLDVLRTERGMASILIGHIKVKPFNDPLGESYDQYLWDINDKASQFLMKWADSILFCNTKTIVKQEEAAFGAKKAKAIDITGGERFLYTQGRPAHPGGGRGVYGRLPYELPLNYQAYMAAVSERMRLDAEPQ
jgi:hypothetical protein